jgi:hypothetical protein
MLQRSHQQVGLGFVGVGVCRLLQAFFKCVGFEAQFCQDVVEFLGKLMPQLGEYFLIDLACVVAVK